MPDWSRRAALRAAVALPAVGTVEGVAGCASAASPFQSTVRVAVSWSAGELVAFRRVLDNLVTPGYRVQVVPRGDDIAATLNTRTTGRPDVVLLPRPGLVAQHREDLESLAPILTSQPSTWPYADIWDDLLLAGGQPYGLPFKIAHKSAVWYRTDIFAKYGLQPPHSWSEWRELNATLIRHGLTPLALGGADGWVLTDFFENILLGSAPDLYDALIAPHSPDIWTSAPVARALRLLGRMWSPRGALPGGAKRSLVLQFSDAVLEVFTYGRAAMVVAPDFAESVINRFATDLSTVGIFPFPSVDGDDAEVIDVPHPPPVVVGGDVAVLPEPSSRHARHLVSRLASPAAPLPWINPDRNNAAGSRRATPQGGFIAANLNTPMTAYSPELRRLAEQLARPGTARTFRFDLSDQLGAVGSLQGLWRVLHDFLRTIGGGNTFRVGTAADEAVARLRDFEKRLIADRGTS